MSQKLNPETKVKRHCPAESFRFSAGKYRSHCRRRFSPTDGVAELPQTYTGSRRDGPSATGVCVYLHRPQDKPAGVALLRVCAKRAGGSRKPLSP